MKRASLLLFSLLLATATFAQPHQLLSPTHTRPGAPVYGARIDVTQKLDRSPLARWSRQEFARLKAAGLLARASKTLPQYTVGDQFSFRLVDNMKTDAWASKTFVLKKMSTGTDPAQVRIWVESGEWTNGHVNTSIVDQLFTALVSSTPSGSYKPARGIIANNNEIFGTPPDVDGDGAVDVLLYDIQEGDENCCVMGYVTSANLQAENKRDILYLDSKEGLQEITDLLQTASHEYQHWINYNYDDWEDTFVNEGLSEWSEIMNGYPGRDIKYLDYPDEHFLPLLYWLHEDPIADYERANHFTTYLAQRLGPQVTGSITRSMMPDGATPARGPDAYRRALAVAGKPALEELLMDFHIANYLNDPSVSPNWAHTLRPGLRAPSSVAFDARVDTETPLKTVNIEEGGVNYLTWDYPKDLSVRIYVPSSDPNVPGDDPTASARIKIKALLFDLNGNVTTRDVALGMTPTQFTGTYRDVTLVVMNIAMNANATKGTSVFYMASWDASQSYTRKSLVYDDGKVKEYVGVDRGDELNTRFKKAGNDILSLVRLPVYHRSQFDPALTTEPRDLTLVFRAATPEGKPGAEVFTVDITDDRPLVDADNYGAPLSYLQVDLTPYKTQLAALPNDFFVGFRDRATVDKNSIILTTSTYTAENVSYISATSGWQRIWDVLIVDENNSNVPLTGRDVPIQLELLAPTSQTAADDESIAGAFGLDQNYPNPFKATTTITYNLPVADDVRLDVFDLIGRRVATLVDGVQAAGSHTIAFNANALPAGMYFYKLQQGGRTETKKMLLIR